MVNTAENVRNLGTILGIWAHPDDEAFSMAGLMSYAKRNGQRVIIVTATRGDAGETADETKWPKEELGAIREQELLKSLEVSGVKSVRILEYLDGTLKGQDEQEAVKKLKEIIGIEQPNTVITFNEDGITGHDDHKTIHKWTNRAVKDKNNIRLLCVVECSETYEKYGKECDEKFNIYFNIDKPNLVSKQASDLCVELDAQAKADKEKALQAHASQTAQMFRTPSDKEMLLNTTTQCECFVEVK